MLSLVQSLQANQKQVEVNLLDIPRLSTATKGVLEKDLFVTLPPDMQSSRSLAGRMQTIETATQTLQMLKEKQTATKITAWLTAAVLVGGLAASIFLTVTVSPYFGFGIGIFSALALIDAAIAYERLDMPVNEATVLLAMTGIGSLIALYEKLSRVSRAEGELNGETASLQQELAAMQKANQANVEKGYRWSQEATGGLMERLGERIQALETSLAAIAKIGESAPHVESRLATLRTAREEFGAQIDFYHQFN